MHMITQSLLERILIGTIFVFIFNVTRSANFFKYLSSAFINHLIRNIGVVCAIVEHEVRDFEIRADFAPNWSCGELLPLSALSCDFRSHTVLFYRQPRNPRNRVDYRSSWYSFRSGFSPRTYLQHEHWHEQVLADRGAAESCEGPSWPPVHSCEGRAWEWKGRWISYKLLPVRLLVYLSVCRLLQLWSFALILQYTTRDCSWYGALLMCVCMSGNLCVYLLCTCMCCICVPIQHRSPQHH